MKQLLKPLQWLYTIYALLLFVAVMIPVFIWSIIVINFGRIRGGNLVYKGCVVWADVWLFLVGIHHRNIYIEKPKKHQPYIFVANHISYLDAAVIPKTFRRNIRALGKVEMSKIPVFGFIYKYAIVTVDRSSTENRAKSVMLLKSILEKEISVLVFPEGTFNTTGKPLKHFYDGAFRVAIETNTPVKPVLLLDTYTRMNYRSIFSLNPGISRSVFLPEIPVEGMTAEDVPRLREMVYKAMEQELLHYGARWIKHHPQSSTQGALKP
jgi:1-acyl-sn-glycerol-3-phosphate acyltransferase